MKNQTAVQWLIKQYFASGDPLNYGHLQKALELERQQIIDAVDGFPLENRNLEGTEYYTQTFTEK